MLALFGDIHQIVGREHEEQLLILAVPFRGYRQTLLPTLHRHSERYGFK